MTGMAPIALSLALAACAPDPAPPAAPVPDIAVPAKSAPPISPAPAPAEPPAAAVPVLAIDGEGLRLFNPVNGSAHSIPFGRPRAATLAALAFRGPPAFARLEECGAGPLDQAAWTDGLRVYFQEGKFVGWALNAGGNPATDKRAITTASGIGPGSSRAALEAAYSAKVVQSSLGTEFSAGDLAGLIDGPGQLARITDMWAGASCNFR